MMSQPSSSSSPKAPKMQKKRTASTKSVDVTGAPLFLRKTYKMIDTCDPEIASWHDGGKTFVVKDIDKFAATVIPQYFNHSKFSSFVRQLNFYGFRKIKSDVLRLAEAGDESNWWKFRHPKFQQGREDLLVEIKKTSHNETVDKQEVEKLRTEITRMKKQHASMNAEIRSLHGEIHGLKEMMANYIQHQHPSSVGVPSKKRKLSSGTSSSVPNSVQSDGGLLPAVLSDAVLDPIPVPSLPPIPSGGHVTRGVSTTSALTLDSQDEAVLAEILAQDDPDIVKIMEKGGTPDVHISALPPLHPEMDPELLAKLREAVKNLPAETQNLFLDRILSTVADPEGLKAELSPALLSMAEEAAREAELKVLALGEDPQGAEAIATSMGILESHLALYNKTADSIHDSHMEDILEI